MVHPYIANLVNSSVKDAISSFNQTTFLTLASQATSIRRVEDIKFVFFNIFRRRIRNDTCDKSNTKVNSAENHKAAKSNRSLKFFLRKKHSDGDHRTGKSDDSLKSNSKRKARMSSYSFGGRSQCSIVIRKMNIVVKSLQNAAHGPKTEKSSKSLKFFIRKNHNREKQAEQKNEVEKSQRNPSESSPREREDTSGKSFGRFRDLSERVSRKMKTFISRPISELAIKKFIGKIEARRQAELDNTLTRRELSPGQTLFPRSRSKSQGERVRNGPDQIMCFKVFADVPDPEVLTQLPSTTIAEDIALNNETSAELITGNKDNDGELLIDGLPFWIAGEEWRQIDPGDNDTDDDLPLNADIILDVDRGEVNLVKMPTVPVILDPLGDLSELRKRDKSFFAKSVLFGNSVRSMINLSDVTSTKVSIKRAKISTLSFVLPESRFVYMRERFWEFTEYPYRPNNATRGKTTRRRSGSVTTSQKDECYGETSS
ncbi:hypothetical protein DICVIV_03106 [Dictyocaulus viviparus]|uniref:Uncharacterized protein n=1 Tax=Dictyocaulus viviparus TaxID=29172 RepID=A0A0D8Y446_DICVI|nr:hypothetical protein DICVIV_03106 [Dictyocaulus viviparus]